MTGQELHRLEGHTDWVFTLCAVTIEGRPLLASASIDRTLRLWEVDTGLCLMSIPIHHIPTAIVQVSDLIAVGLAAGLLGIQVVIAS